LKCPVVCTLIAGGQAGRDSASARNWEIMPAPLVKRAIWTVAAICLALAVVAASLPFVASTQLVRARITQELSERTGYRVTLGEAPDLVIWPSFKAILNDVSFRRRGADDGPPVLEAERLEARLSAWTAVLGGVELSAVTLERPVLHISRQPNGTYLPAAPGGGRFAEMLEDAARGEAHNHPALGTVRFADGKLVDASTGADVATDLTGMVEWETIGSQALLNAAGVWRGEDLKVALLVEAPLKLAAGQSSAANVSFESAPLTASFAGTVGRGESMTFDGTVNVASPSVRRALEWSQAEIKPGASMGKLTLSGRASGDLQRLKLADARLSLSDNPGTGALELSLAGPVPSVSGTLAFETLDLGTFLAAFANTGDGTDRLFDLGFTDQFSLDLRLSATRARGGGAELADVAATAQVRSGFAAFDISDATALGGEIQAGFRVDRKEGGEFGEMRVSGEEIDWAMIATMAGWKRNVPAGKGSLSLVLKSPVDSWALLSGNLSGTVSAKLGPGTITDLDLTKLLSHAPGSGFFPLESIGDGSLAVDGAEFKATLGSGVAKIATAKAWTAQEMIKLDGIIPYVGRSLALSGSVSAKEGATSTLVPDRERRFFIGGSWGSPYISPISPEFEP
jgi:AsmA protein